MAESKEGLTLDSGRKPLELTSPVSPSGLLSEYDAGNESVQSRPIAGSAYMAQGGGVYSNNNKSPSVNEEKLKAYFEKKGHQGNQFNNLNHLKHRSRKQNESESVNKQAYE